MTITRHDMIKALRTTVVPELRQLGFKGWFPHFHGDLDGHIDPLMSRFG